jgi:hypothetical protein
MAEIREIVERFRNCDRRGLEEVLALLPLMQGQLDPTSFIAGMLFGRSGGGDIDSMAALLLATTANNNAQNTGGTVSSAPVNNMMLPLFMLLAAKPDWRGEREIEVFEKQRPAK